MAARGRWGGLRQETIVLLSLLASAESLLEPAYDCSQFPQIVPPAVLVQCPMRSK
ncbi:hypothetical protein P4O66_016397, partial [Electrophorus voltai]